MPINQTYIEMSVPMEHRTSFLKRTIQMDLGNYLDKRPYYFTWALRESINKLRDCQHIEMGLTDYIRECVISAHDRGVFVVCSRIISHPELTANSPEAFIELLKKREGSYFDAMKWYRLDDFEHELEKKRYTDDAIREVSPFILRHVRVAFTLGIKQAVNQLFKEALVGYR